MSAYLERRTDKTGKTGYWIMDMRQVEGRRLLIGEFAGDDLVLAIRSFDKYVVRKDLEKEGYDDGLAG